MNDVTEPPILTTLHEGVLTITLNRPHRLNAFTAEMHQMMLETLRGAQRDPGVRVIVVAGAGRGFCAGYDVQEGAKPAPGDDIAVKWADDPKWMSVENIAARLREDAEIPYLLHTMPKVTIAAVRGPAAGSGLCLAASCDIRIASDTAMFKTAFASLGRCGDPGPAARSRAGLGWRHGVCDRLPQRIGVKSADLERQAAPAVQADQRADRSPEHGFGRAPASRSTGAMPPCWKRCARRLRTRPARR